MPTAVSVVVLPTAAHVQLLVHDVVDLGQGAVVGVVVVVVDVVVAVLVTIEFVEVALACADVGFVPHFRPEVSK